MQRIVYWIPVLLLSLVSASGTGCASDARSNSWPAAADTAVVRLLEVELQNGTSFDREFPALRPVDADIKRFYEKHDYRAAWFDGDEPTDLAMDFLDALLAADQDALDREAYRPNRLTLALEMLKESPLPREVLRAELEFTRAFFQFAGHHLEGQVDPQTLASEVYLKVPQARVDSVLTDVLEGRYSGSIRDHLVPRSDRYAALQNALIKYRAMAENGDWPTVPEGDTVEPGEKDPRIPALRARLAATGELNRSRAGEDSTFDDAVLEALARFQKRHGLAVDSTLGPNTLAALNVPIGDRIRQIEMSMERLRWLPTEMGDRRIVVNIPEFKVYGYDGGERALEMRVVVGSEYGGQETPVFSDEMDHVVFNPYWNVPYSIATNEMLPRIREDASYLPSRGFEVIGSDGEVLPAGSVNPDDIASGAVRIRQKPSSTNALGLVKFMFPNRHSIYLHDSPADHLFAEAERDFSHGCIRLEDPPRFGAFVLGKQGWSQADVESAIGARDRQVVQLEEHIPVYIMYMTAVVEDDGTVRFRDDVYGNDEALLRALTKLREATGRAAA